MLARKRVRGRRPRRNFKRHPGTADRRKVDVPSYHLRHRGEMARTAALLFTPSFFSLFRVPVRSSFGVICIFASPVREP